MIKRILTVGALGIAFSSMLMATENESALSSEPGNNSSSSEIEFITQKDKGNVFADIRFGTLGVGIEGGYIVNDYLKVRGSMNYFGININDVSLGDNKMDIKYEHPIGGVILDYHPFGGGFRFSGGLMISGLSVKGDAQNTNSLQIGDKYYTPDDISSLHAKASWNTVQPYLGFGYGASSESGFFFSFDLGVVFIGSMKLDITAQGTIANQQEFQEELARERKKIDDDIPSIPVYPVLMIGVGYVF